ncbi:unnamed protein product [Protopolystoma xenopodis]|uniref:Uncharacterized protein n=1 Tax=Protopolystoma xenopodis TaxID=117903 RepID=A0A3S5ASF4_9PLAT|nr:unnamed protein product [Protopolystoma xenopodis]
MLFIIAVYHWLTSRARSEATQSTHPGTQINKRNSENEYASLANKTKQLSGVISPSRGREHRGNVLHSSP